MINPIQRALQSAVTDITRRSNRKRHRWPMTALASFLASVCFLGPDGDSVAAGSGQVDTAKIKGCWRVWVKGTDRERRGRTFQITNVTETGSIEGMDVYGTKIVGSFEPAERSWLGHLGTLILHSPTYPLGGYGPDRPPGVFRHPSFSLEPAETLFPIGPTMPPGVVRPFAMYETGVGRGLTIGAADRLYRCDPDVLLAPMREEPEPLGADPPQGP